MGQESFHLVHALSTALLSSAAWEFSVKRTFEQKKEISTKLSFCTYFLGKCLLRKASQIPAGLGRAAPEGSAFQQPGTRRRAGENRDQHLALPHPKWLPASPGCHLHWHGCLLWGLCRKPEKMWASTQCEHWNILEFLRSLSGWQNTSHSDLEISADFKQETKDRPWHLDLRVSSLGQQQEKNILLLVL